MAIYRLEKKIISRSCWGRSVMEAAAYQSGTQLCLTAPRLGDKDAKPRCIPFEDKPIDQVVLYSQILAPKDGPSWLQNIEPKGGDDAENQRQIRERLWNTVESAEKRKDSQLAFSYVATLARELTLDQRIELVRNWCDEEFVSKGFVVDFSMHDSTELGHNPHCHILVTTRPVAGEGFGKKPNTAGKFNARALVGLITKNELIAQRESYARHENAALEKAGRPERVDHRSLKNQGIDREPEPKLGVAATAMRRRDGVEADTDNHHRVRQTRMLNELRPYFQALRKHGYIPDLGTSGVWWQRSLTWMQRIRDYAVEAVKGGWERLISRQREDGPTRELERD